MAVCLRTWAHRWLILPLPHPQASVEKEMGALPMATDADREEVDLRSIFVGNVRGNWRDGRLVQL